MADYRTLFSPSGTGSAVTVLVALSLLLLLSQATSDPCYDPGGRPRFCLPPVTQLVGKAAAPCSQTCALPADSPDPVCNGTLTLDLDGSFLLTSVTLRFCTAGPPALVLSAAWAIGGPWRPLWRRPAWPGVLGGPKKVTFHSPPGPKTRIVASYLRVELGGKAGLVTTGVRGRCQCHGHAARCAARAQPPRCRCRHHTTGPGCESCRPSHRDWPWRPATPQHPHPCLPCSCNQHARRCRFNSELFRLSGGRSGGVCERCRHHTAGRHCHYCQPGFWRDPSQPITSPKACRACQCHPIGATGGMCNQTSGQCSCKLGVTGLTCNHCGPGYQQSRSPRMPCQRIPEATTALATTPVASRSDPQCQGYCNVSVSSVHMNLQKYCQQDYVLHARVAESAQVSASSSLSSLSEAVGPEWWRLAVHVLAVFKQRAWPVRRGSQEAWVPRADLSCGCLRLRPGADYLLLGRAAENHTDPAHLILNRHSLALPWRPRWAGPLRRLQQKERGGACRGLLPPTRSPGPRN
ncbi:netrin-5 isoform 1 precursor [Rattus norvegicus]|uniref:netrin-5 isoform 1 precursor n=1 Tax=Rattus norvegicus TaxID=10116 RepID=UPI0004E48671|nr:netrin-5 isoform 1 precursor [Rattus norvegicus]|eukprot:XP_008757602.1 PREDICTED: netrin-5 isoform X1 [Rattus norvegicus]